MGGLLYVTIQLDVGIGYRAFDILYEISNLPVIGAGGLAVWDALAWLGRDGGRSENWKMHFSGVKIEKISIVVCG